DQICVTSELDRTFAREEVENLRRVGAGDLDERVQVESAGFDAVSIEKIDPILQRRNTVRNFGEVIAAHHLLTCKIKRRVIGADGIYQTLSQTIPKDWLVCFVAQGRGHHKFRSFKLW